MDTSHALTIEKNEASKQLFQDLFLIQFQLKNYQDHGFNYQQELREIIEAMDQLMETTLLNYELPTI